MNNIVFADAYCSKNFQNFLIKLKKNKQLSEDARYFYCHQYWKGIDIYKCTGQDGICTTIDINAIQNNDNVCDAIKAQIEMIELDKKLPYAEDIVNFTFYDVEKVKKYLSPTVLPWIQQEKWSQLLEAENKGIKAIEYNQDIQFNIKNKEKGNNILEIIDSFCDKKTKQCENNWITSIYEIKKGYHQPYGNGILIRKVDRIAEGTLFLSGIYFCRFEEFNKVKLLKCYKL